MVGKLENAHLESVKKLGMIRLVTTWDPVAGSQEQVAGPSKG